MSNISKQNSKSKANKLSNKNQQIFKISYQIVLTQYNQTI